MLDRIFPKQFDNVYRGHWLGLVLFMLVIAVKALQGIETLILPADTIVRADGVPIDKFGALAGSEAILMFALLGMWLLVIPLQSVVVLIRYRSMIPFMLLLLIAVQLGARMVHVTYPTLLEIQHAPAPFALYVNLSLMALTVIAFILSVVSKPRHETLAPRNATGG